MTEEEYGTLSTNAKEIFSKVLKASKKSIVKKLKSEKTINEIDSKKVWKCEKCNWKFSSKSGLGGHLAKAHPGQSEAFNHKKKVRALRELDR